MKLRVVDAPKQPSADLLHLATGLVLVLVTVGVLGFYLLLGLASTGVRLDRCNQDCWTRP